MSFGIWVSTDRKLILKCRLSRVVKKKNKTKKFCIFLIFICILFFDDHFVCFRLYLQQQQQLFYSLIRETNYYMYYIVELLKDLRFSIWLLLWLKLCLFYVIISWPLLFFLFKRNCLRRDYTKSWLR